ncbi:hypothetical protein KIPB_009982, partial [Kipferlia bialata]|eukprot:g9982.t1
MPQWKVSLYVSDSLPLLSLLSRSPLISRYNPNTGAQSLETCVACPAGKYCAGATSVPADCPEGYYCPVGSPDPEPCPIGTYGTSTGLKKVAECTSCDAGSYCSGLGQTDVSGPCDAGFYCSGGAYTSAPPDGATGGLCPTGGYCPQGSTVVQPCAAGKYNPNTGMMAADDCLPCPAGQYCEGSSSDEVSGDCSAGYYCTGSATTAYQVVVTAGYYSLSGAADESPCAPGTYNSDPAQESCLACPAGAYCPDSAMETYTSCPEGNYCEGSTITPTECPVGTYRSDPGGVDVDGCSACSGGKACTVTGLDTPDVDCQAGYYCTSGAETMTPTDGVTGDVCPAGNYCPAGSSAPTVCPVGTWSPDTGNTKLEDCVTCSPGKYCPLTGMSNLDAYDCSGGYYCSGGSSLQAPLADNGGRCSIGNYCEAGSFEETACDAGSYSDEQGLAACKTCPAGYYCPAGATAALDCEVGYYCPESTTESMPVCPVGTYSEATNLQDESQCTPCDAGHYCETAGASAVGALCSEGYYCSTRCGTAQGGA